MPNVQKEQVLIKKVFIAVPVFLGLCLIIAYLGGMFMLGGFDKQPEEKVLPSIKIESRQIRLDNSDSFTFAVMGDMRWDDKPKQTVLHYSQSLNPDFMVNLADVTEYSRASEWERYINMLKSEWDVSIPYYHIPGGHSVNIRADGIRPAFYEHYFGKTYYTVKKGDWSLFFLDTYLGFIPGDEFEWLRRNLEQVKNDKIIIFMHHPPYDEQKGVTHALWKNETKRLYSLLKHYDVKGIFAAHIHSVFEYDWHGIPVYITSLQEDTGSRKPAVMRYVSIDNENIRVENREAPVN